MSQAIIIRPVAITADMLVSSTAAETYDLFEPDEPYHIYSFGDIVRSAEDTRLYENLVPLGQSYLTTITPGQIDPIEFNRTEHGLADGDVVTFKAGTGPLINEVRQGVLYRVRPVDTNKFNLYASLTDPDPDDLLDMAAGQTLWYYYFYKGDPNSGWYSDPGMGIDYEAAYPNTPITTPRWLDIGSNNTWSMFDGYVGGATTFEGDGVVVLDIPAHVDSAGFEGLVGATLQVVVNDGSTDVYDSEPIELTDNSGVVDWYSFFFAERYQKSAVVLDDLPFEVAAPRITVTITGDAPEIGMMAVGRKFEIGKFHRGLKVGNRSYSTKETNDFGNYQLVRRANSKRSDGQATIENAKLDQVQRVLAQYDAVPIFWRLAEGYSATVLFGFYRDFNIEIAYPRTSLVSYEIEGVI